MTAITISREGVAVQLEEGQFWWSDELSWNPVVAQTEYSSTGALVIDTWVKQSGRPITLSVSDSTTGFVPRADLDVLHAWANDPLVTMQLQIGTDAPRDVAFKHQDTPVIDVDRPMWPGLVQQPTDLIRVSNLKFLAL